jgi:hypothetical protein
VGKGLGVGLGKGVGKGGNKGVGVGVGKGVDLGLGKGVGVSVGMGVGGCVVKGVSVVRLDCELAGKGEGAYRLLGLQSLLLIEIVVKTLLRFLLHVHSFSSVFPPPPPCSLLLLLLLLRRRRPRPRIIFRGVGRGWGTNPVDTGDTSLLLNRPNGSKKVL